MKVLLYAAAAALALGLGACSGAHHAEPAPPAVAVSVVPAMRQTFHSWVDAYGELGADRREALALSLPQAGEIIATDAIPGRRVARGAALLQLRTDPATRSAYLQAQSAVTVAREDLSHTARLHAEKLATNAQLDAARKALADAEANLAAQAQLGGASAVAVLKAPAAGVVTALDVHRGQRIAAGTTLLQFTPDAALTALLGVDPAAATTLRTGMPVALTPVYGAAPGAPPLRATVALVGAAVNPVTHLVDVVATFATPPVLPAGTALSARIDARSFTAWSVPRDALQNDAHGSYVFQVVAGKARRVDVKVLAPAGSPVGVAGAIDPHAPIITVGSYEVTDGDAVCASPGSGAGNGCRKGG